MIRSSRSTRGRRASSASTCCTPPAPTPLCFVHLSHGMQAHYDGDHLLDAVLDRIDRPSTVARWSRPGRSRPRQPPGRDRRAAMALATRWVQWTDRPRARGTHARHRACGPTGAGSRSPTTPSWGRSGSTSSAGARGDRDARGGQPPPRGDHHRAARADQPRHRRYLSCTASCPPRTCSIARRVTPSRTSSSSGSARRRSSGSGRRASASSLAPYEHWRTGDHHDDGLLLVHGAETSSRGIARSPMSHDRARAHAGGRPRHRAALTSMAAPASTSSRAANAVPTTAAAGRCRTRATARGARPGESGGPNDPASRRLGARERAGCGARRRP